MRTKEKEWATTECKAYSDLKVTMAANVWEYLMGWCKAASSEVSGMMLVEYDATKKALHVSNIYLPKQDCDSASTEIDDEAMAGLQMMLHKEKKNLKSLRGWWHTHYNFNVFWSSTDTDTIGKLMSGNEWFLSIVVNQAGDFKARVDISTPFPLVIDDMDIEVIGATEDLSKFKTDIDSQVTRKVYQTTHFNPLYGEYPYMQYSAGRWGDGHETYPYTSVKDNMKIIREIKPYEGKWWERFDPESWHGYKGSKSIAPVVEKSNPLQHPGQTDENFLMELAAERELEAQYRREAGDCGLSDKEIREILGHKVGVE